MKRWMFGWLWLLAGVALLLCWTAPAFAQYGDPQFAIESTSGSLWGELTSPYGTDHVGSVICDDFVDTVQEGSEHNYNSISANSLIMNSMQGIWSGNGYGSATQLYQAASALVLQVYHSSGLVQEELNWAIWALFDPSGAVAFMNTHQDSNSQAGCDAIFGAGSYQSGACTGGSGGYIGNALANGNADYLAGDFNGLVVYIPYGTGSGSGGPCMQTTPNPTDNYCDSQEFFGQVPDGGSALMYLGLAGLSCFGAMFRSRGRTKKSGLA